MNGLGGQAEFGGGASGSAIRIRLGRRRRNSPIKKEKIISAIIGILASFKSLGPIKQFEATAKLRLYISGIKNDAAGAERRPLIDCGTGRFRLVKGEDGELKEEEIQDASE